MGRTATAAGQIAGYMCLAGLMAFSARAGELAKGDIVEVRPRSMWFEDARKLQEWQQLRTLGDVGALAAHEQRLLAAREAWQFSGVVKARVLEHDRDLRQLKVQTLTPGRLSGSSWFLDEGARLD